MTDATLPAAAIIVRLDMSVMRRLRRVLTSHLVPRVDYGNPWPSQVAELYLDTEHNEHDFRRAYGERCQSNSPEQIKAYELDLAVREQARINSSRRLYSDAERRSVTADEFIDTALIALWDYTNGVSRTDDPSPGVNLSAMVDMVFTFARATPHLLPMDIDEREVLLAELKQAILAEFSQ